MLSLTILNQLEDLKSQLLYVATKHQLTKLQAFLVQQRKYDGLPWYLVDSYVKSRKFKTQFSTSPGTILEAGLYEVDGEA